jgi:hypothetical protein
MRLSQPARVIVAALKSLGRPSSERMIFEEAHKLKAPLKREEINHHLWYLKQKGLVVDASRKGFVALDDFYDLILEAQDRSPDAQEREGAPRA